MAFSGARVMEPNLPCPCGTGVSVGRCHPALTRAPEPDEFYSSISDGLAAYPALSSLLPEGYPAKGRYRVLYERALSFEWERTARYPHHVNLPLMLSIAGNLQSVDHLRRYAKQTLAVFEQFACEFGRLVGVSGVLSPLWQGAWDKEPVFWSVLAHCHIAIATGLSGCVMVRFEAPIGNGHKTADIHFRTPRGLDVFQDIEIWNAPVVQTFECSGGSSGSEPQKRQPTSSARPSREVAFGWSRRLRCQTRRC